jgi:hypothetical protein
MCDDPALENRTTSREVGHVEKGRAQRSRREFRGRLATAQLGRNLTKAIRHSTVARTKERGR